MNFTTILFLVTLIALIYLYLKVKSLETAYTGYWFLLNSLAKQIVKNTDVTSEGLNKEIRNLYTEFPDLAKGSLSRYSAMKTFYPDKLEETVAKLQKI